MKKNTMKFNIKIMLCCFLSVMYSFVFSMPGFSQETTPESLRLPEVMITGIEHLKIQRELPKVTPVLSPLIVSQTMRDRSEHASTSGSPGINTAAAELKNIIFRPFCSIHEQPGISTIRGSISGVRTV